MCMIRVFGKWSRNNSETSIANIFNLELDESEPLMTVKNV